MEPKLERNKKSFIYLNILKYRRLEMYIQIYYAHIYACIEFKCIPSSFLDIFTLPVLAKELYATLRIRSS